MGKKSLKILVSALLFVLCYSCVPVSYLPTTLNMPLPEEKGDFKGEVNALNYTGGIQASYALTDHVVILGDLSLLEFQYPFGETIFYMPQINHNFFSEIGAGYYSHPHANLKYEFIGGWGYGKSSSLTQLWIHGGSGPGVKMDATMPGIFVQGDLGNKWGRHEINYGLRCRIIDMSGSFSRGEITPSGNFYKDLPNDPEYNRDNKTVNGIAFFAEPCIKYTAGLGICRWNFSLGCSIKIKGPDLNLGQLYIGPNLYDPLILSTGLTIMLGRK